MDENEYNYTTKVPRRTKWKAGENYLRPIFLIVIIFERNIFFPHIFVVVVVVKSELTYSFQMKKKSFVAESVTSGIKVATSMAWSEH